MQAKIAKQLESIAASGTEFESRAYQLTQAWSEAGVGIEAVTSVLRFMESNPSLDYGSPGPLVHFVERFDDSMYIESLLTSIAGKPTAHTAWMLNRAINAAATPEARRVLIEAMERARRHSEADEDAVNELSRFLEFQTKVGP